MKRRIVLTGPQAISGVGRRVGEGSLGMRRFNFAVFLALLFMVPTHPASAGVVEPYKAVYEFKRSVGKAEINYSVEEIEGEYVVSNVVQAKGAAKLLAGSPVREESRFRIDNDTIIPMKYIRGGGASNGSDNASVEFDWDRSIASGTEDGNQGEFEISQGGTFDMLTAELAVRSALAEGAREVSFDVIEGAEKVRYSYHPQGTENVKVGGETVETVVYRLDRGSRRMFYYWFAPAMNYLVVKIEQRVGDEIKGTITLKSIK